MTRSHRRVHRAAFVVLAIVLPVLVAIAIAGRSPVDVWPLPVVPRAMP